jgi:hypothetical protein
LPCRYKQFEHSGKPGKDVSGEKPMTHSSTAV